MSNPSRLIAIGELARRTGLASSALRYYERAGLLSPTARAGGTTALRVLERRAPGLDPTLPRRRVHASRDLCAL